MTVEELRVRFSANASSYLSGMRDASRATDDFKKTARKSAESVNGSMQETSKRARAMAQELVAAEKEQQRAQQAQQKAATAFDTAKQKQTEYAEKIKALNEEIERNAKEAAELEAAYARVKKAMEDAGGGSSSLGEQYDALVSYIQELSSRYKHLQEQKARLEAGKYSFSSFTPKEIYTQLDTLPQKIREAEDELKRLTSIMDGLSDSDIDYSGDEGLASLKAQIDQSSQKLEKARAEVSKLSEAQRKNYQAAQAAAKANRDAGERVRAAGDRISQASDEVKRYNNSLRVAAAVRNFLSMVRSIGSATASGAGKIKTFFSRIRDGKNSINSTGESLKRMVKSIRNLALVAYSARIARAAFGKLRSLVSQTVSSSDVMSSRVEVLKNQLSQALAPAINVVISVFERLMPVVLSCVNAISQLISSIFGGQWTQLSSGASSAAGSIEDVADATNAAAAAADNLQGFDKINKISDTTSASSASGGVGTSTSPGSASADTIFSRIKEAFEAADFTDLGISVAEKLNGALASIPWEKIQSTCQSVALSITTFINGFTAAADWQLVGYTIADGVNTAVSFVNTLLTTASWGDFGAAFSSTLNGILEKTDWNGTGQILCNGINAALAFVSSAVSDLNWPGIGTALRELIEGAFSDINWKDVGSAINGAVTGVIQMISSFFEGADPNATADAITSALEDLFREIDFGAIIQKALDLAGKVLSFTVTMIGKIVYNLAQDLADWVIEHSGGLLVKEEDGSVSFHIEAILDWNWGKGAGSSVADKLGINGSGGTSLQLDAGLQLENGAVENLFGDLKKKWSGFAKALEAKMGLPSDTGKRLYETVGAQVSSYGRGKAYPVSMTASASSGSSTMTAFEKFFNAAKRAVSVTVTTTSGKTGAQSYMSAWNGVIKALKVPVSLSQSATTMGTGFVSAFKKAAGSITLKVKYKTTGLSASLRKVMRYLGFSGEPYLTWMARGGVVTRPTIAGIGENGAEAVMPLEHNTGWIDQLAGKIAEKGGTGGQATSVVIPIYIGGKKITETVVEDINRQTRASGVSPIMVY